jgi:hypothetical protein
MRKHLLAACLSLAVAAAMPATASAKPVLKHATWTVAPVGTKIMGTNVGNITMSNGIGSITCSTASLTGALTVNETSNGFEANITSLKFGGTTGKTIAGDEEPECTGTGNYAGGVAVTWTAPFCLESTAETDTTGMRGGLCAESSRAVVFHTDWTSIFGTIACSYQRSSLAGTFKTYPEDAILTFSELTFTKLAGSGGECPTEFKTNMTFTLETDNVTAEPMAFFPK